MIKKDHRLAKKRDFKILMDKGQWISGQFFNLRSLRLANVLAESPKKVDPAEFVAQWKYAVTAGVKISKSAVKRNRVKRRAVEILRLIAKDHPEIAGVYGLFVAKPGVLDTEYINLEQDINQLVKKARWI